MQVESTAIYRCTSYVGSVARAGARSQAGLSGDSCAEGGDSAAASQDAAVHSNADGDTVEISAQGQKAALGQLDSEAQQVVAQLKTVDQEVRSHEMAHLAAAGAYAQGGPRYEYTRGPDGVPYAVGGEVSIDVSPEPGDPEATIRKAETVRAAALAPATPSGQDRQVAAAATKLEIEAQVELANDKTLALAEAGQAAESREAQQVGNSAASSAGR